jgi:hypothetical protein
MRDHVASMTGERPPEVLGSLPRTRPHRRSQKRPARPPHAEPAAAKPSAAKTGPAKPRTAKPRAAGPQPARLRQPAQPAGSPPGPRIRHPAPSNGSDVLGTAVQAAAELAEIGLTVGGRAIRGAVARLPRP